MLDINKILSTELKITIKQVESVISLLDDGNTVPFIARYRKEVTGALSDEILRNFEERLIYLRNLKDRKEDVLRLIEGLGKLNDEIVKSLENAKSLTEVEDIYRPYKQKKRTRATMALERGLKGLADILLSGIFNGDIKFEASKFIDEEKDVKTLEDALLGAQDIIAEQISDDAKYRKWIRNFLSKEGKIQSIGNTKDSTAFDMYYDYSEEVSKIPSHRILAINRGEKEKILSVKILSNEEKIIFYLEKEVLKGNPITDIYLKAAIKDSLKRLIYPSIEREIRNYLTDIGEEGAIKIFKENLKSLLMQPPIKGKVVMGYDPGFRTGCKVAILDKTGRFLENITVYPTEPQKKVKETKEILKKLIYKYDVEIISLGNGTASRESEEIISEMISEIKKESNKIVEYLIVSEAGASVYSASSLASKEYPNLDVTVRGAISIGRRLQDPMAELVKIDPKALGVGQYQHDVSPKRLDESLKSIVEDSVNKVGVDLNIATSALLNHISGISASIADNIVSYRDEIGFFKSRKELLKVKRLGQKAYEQCAGFLRISDGLEPLDNTSVHPESYDLAKNIIAYLGYDKEDLKNNYLNDIEERANKKSLDVISRELNIGKITLEDIIKELKKPGRDIRDEMIKPILKTGIINLEDLEEGMILMGTVRNVSDFGAFVDIGVHQDGLVHKSQMADRFINHPLDVVKVGEVIKVKIMQVDIKRKRISLSMKEIN